MPHRKPPNLTLTNWDLGGEPSAWGYLQAGELFTVTEIAPPSQAAQLAHAERPEIARFAVQPGTSLDEYVSSEPVSGIVVVLGGQIVFERYPRMRPGDRHLLMSVTKVFTSAIVGIRERRGMLDLAQPVDTVIGELAGSGWAGVTGHDVTNMASGIDCLEIDSPGAYTDPGHPNYRFEASLGWRPATGEPDTYALVASLPSHRQPGQVYEYTSVNTFVLSWLVERVTGGRLPPASRQWNFVMEDGDLFKSGFGGQGLYVSPARDLVIAFAGTPRLDGSVNQLGWFSRRLALAFG
jgi:CubicO group peptidase (beta-lactamase class C family)